MISPKLILYGVVLALLLFFVGRFYKLEKDKVSSDFVATQTKVVVDSKAKDDVAVDKIDVRYQEVVKVEIQYVDREVIKKVIEYRERVVNRCVLDPHWVHTHNLSTQQAGGSNPTGGMDGKTSDTGNNTD